MKDSNEQIILDQLIREYGKEIALLEFESAFIVRIFKKTKEDLKEEVAHMNSSSAAWAHARDVTNHTLPIIMIEIKAAENEELVEALDSNLNAQHLSLLVSAYESYEKFFKNLYGALGFFNKNIWRCADFGKIELGEVEKKELKWFQDQARNSIARHNIKEILQVLRKKIEDFELLEENNESAVNIRFWTGIISVFRHIAVHNRGSVDCSRLIELIERETGHSLKGGSSGQKDKLDDILKYAESIGGICRLCLVGRDSIDNPRIGVTNSPFLELIRTLNNHVCLAYVQVSKHFALKPFWERE